MTTDSTNQDRRAEVRPPSPSTRSELLVRCGLSYSRGKDQLICYGENMPVDVLLVRDDDIPRLVQEDICDLGIVGLNIIEERRLELTREPARRSCSREIGRLDFGQCRLSFGLPVGVPLRRARSMLQGKRIATTYPRILADYLEEATASRRRSSRSRAPWRLRRASVKPT